MSGLKVGSLFAGVGGFDMGLEAAGFEVAWQVEIDKDAVSVLERHYPNTHRVRDVRDAGAHNLTPVDVISFGSPCQGFSVAGRGEGLEDERSGLFAEAVRIITELRPAVAVWENVPGAYSANDGRDFGAVLAALAHAGAVDIAWRVLDAQWFGVPQRRRRIFLVADFGAERAASVLFEPEGSRRDSEACRAPWEGAPGDAEDGAGSVVSIQYGARPREYSQGLGVAVDGPCYTLDTMGEHADGVLAPTIMASGAGFARTGGEDFCIPVTGDGVAHAVTCHTAKGGDPSTDNYAIAFKWEQGADAGSLAISSTLAPTLGVSQTPAVAIAQNQRGELREMSAHPALATGGGKPGEGYPAAREGMAVRRLTPRECERLMGWPDDWTRYRADGSEISDGPRYRMIGNGVVKNVAEWIGRRLMTAMEGAS